MSYRRLGLFLPILCSLFVLRTVVADATRFDLVTMRSGDIHNGTVAHEVFVFETRFGVLSVPYGLMAKLEIGDGEKPDLLVTRLGESFRGQLRDERVTILRTLDTALPLAVNDIATIGFAPRQLRRRGPLAPDAVETGTGDRFFARIALDELTLDTESEPQTIKATDIYLIDITQRGDEEEPVAQVLLDGGRILQGLIPATSFRAQTQYGQALEIPVADLSRMAFRVNHRNARPDFNHRRHILPSSLIRDRMTDGTPGPETIALRGGSFVRGDAQGDTDERPPVELKLKPFAIGIFEVSFHEYDLFCRDTGRDKPDDSGWGRGRRPVINVSWNDAVAYTEWLSRKTRRSYRLPTDAEWEYTARADSLSKFWWGNEPGTGRANCEGCGSLWDGDRTAPVGRFYPNSFGIHDTAGNVFEWVADCYHDSFADAARDGSSLDKPDCGKRVIRGGAWSFPPKEIRSANRWRDFPSRTSDDTGFRVVRELE